MGKYTEWNKYMSTSKIKQLFFFYIILIIIAGMVTGNALNHIGLYKITRRIKSEGIPYDSFREMKLTDKMILPVKQEMKSVDFMQQYAEKAYLKSMDYLTVNMMVNHYNTKKAVKINRNNYYYFIRTLSGNCCFLELKKYYSSILRDIKCFPVAKNLEGEMNVSFEDSWNAYRTYGGIRRHEGTDLMPEENIRGVYSIVSMTDGYIEKMGWLDKGGYRVGVRGTSGAYYYYAHLESYAPGLKVGDEVKAGQFLGYMGDSGYGIEGTTGKFDVHLHFGIYVQTPFGELSVNPYWILCFLENE